MRFTMMFRTVVDIPQGALRLVSNTRMKYSASCERAVCAVFHVSILCKRLRFHSEGVTSFGAKLLTSKTARFVPNAVWLGCYISITWLKHPTHTSATKHHHCFSLLMTFRCIMTVWYRIVPRKRTITNQSPPTDGGQTAQLHRA